MLTSPLSLSNLAHAQVVDGVPLVDLRPTATNPAFAGDKAVGVKKRRASRVQGRQRDRSRYARTVHAHARDVCVHTCMLTYCIASCSNPPPSPTAALTLSSTVEDFDLEEDPTFLALSASDVAYAVHIAVQNIEYLFGSDNLAQVQCIICVCVCVCTCMYVCACEDIMCLVNLFLLLSSSSSLPPPLVFSSQDTYLRSLMDCAGYVPLAYVLQYPDLMYSAAPSDDVLKAVGTNSQVGGVNRPCVCRREQVGG